MKRIIAIFLAITSLCTFLLIPVSATELDAVYVNAYQRNFIDIMDYAIEYNITVYRTNGTSVNVTYNDPNLNLTGNFSRAVIKWGNNEDTITSDAVYLAIEMSQLPDLISLSNVVGTYVSSSGDTHFYRFALTGNFYAHFTLDIDLPEGWTGTISLISAYCIQGVTEKVESLNFTYIGQYYNSGDQSYYTETIDTVNMDLTNDTADSVFYGFETRPLRNYFSFRWDAPVPYCDLFSFTFTTPNPLLSQGLLASEERIGVQVIDISGSTEYILPYTLEKVLASTSVSGQPNYIYTLNFETHDLNLANRDIEIRMELDPFFPYGGDNLYTTYSLNVLDVAYILNVHKVPWYLHFYRWITNFFSSTFSTLNNNLNNWFTSLETTIQNALGLNAAPPDISDQQQAIEDNSDSMDDLGTDIESSREELESIMPNMPSWEDTGLDGFDDIVGSYIQEIRLVFSAIWENDIIVQLLTYTFLFSLGGFVLFGER